MHQLILISSISLLCLTASRADDDISEAPKQGLTSLKFLPAGSILKRVKVPRYDKNLKPVSLVLADEIKVVNKDLVTAKNLKLKQFASATRGKLKVHLEEALYSQSKGTIKCTQNVTILNDELSTKATGLILHWQTKRGYLFGPVHTSYSKKNRSTMFSPKQNLNALIACSLIGSATCAEPTALTPEKVAKLKQERLAPLQDVHTKADVEQAKQLQLAASEQQNQALIFLKEFAPEKAQIALISTTEVDKDAPKIPEGDTSDQLDVKCDGGMFFDAEKGFLNYQKNVIITEPRFKLSCSKELKVYLATPKKNADGKAANTGKNIKSITAVGNVSIQGTLTDEKTTRSIKASAELAEYDYVKGTILLEGGYPIIHSKENGRTLIVTAQEKGLWIKIEKDGSFKTSKGKWHKRIQGLSNLDKENS